MFFPSVPSVLFLVALARSSNAQIIIHEDPTSRIYAGSIIGGVFFIIIACGMIYIWVGGRRRFHREQYTASRWNRPSQPARPRKPLFGAGGFWRRSNTNNNANTGPAGTNQPSAYTTQNPPTSNEASGVNNQNPNMSSLNQPSVSYNPNPIGQVSSQPSNPHYSVGTPPGPPPYGQEADYGKIYTPPPGPPPPASTQNTNISYGPPVPPPPVAYPTGENNRFVGGFYAPP